MPLTPADVNSHVRTLTGGAFTAKDFRTLRGTIFAAETLARIGAVDTAKERKRAERSPCARPPTALGNTPAVAREQLHRSARLEGVRARATLLELGISPESAIQRLLPAAE